MRPRPLLATTFLAVVVVIGCQKQPSSRPVAELPPLADDSVLRVHWIGKKRLSLDGSAFYLNRLWDSQESRTLENRALEMLSVAPWRLLHGEASISNAPTMLFRWILESVKYEECYLEVRASTNKLEQLALAIRFSEESHAKTWQSNLALVVHSLSGFSPMGRGKPRGWSVIHPESSFRIELIPDGPWTLFGVATEREDTLLYHLLRHVRTNREDPFASRATNIWLRADIDTAWAARAAGLTNSGFQHPKISLALSGDGASVFSHCTAVFEKALEPELPPWIVPIDQIREPLTSFYAVRGNYLVSSLPISRVGHIEIAPTQFSLWSRAGNPFEIYAAAPLTNAAGKISLLGEYLVNTANPWLRSNGPNVNGQGVPLFSQLPQARGFQWDLPGVWPFVRSIHVGGSEFVIAGLTPQKVSDAGPVLDSRLTALQTQTNLLYFSWEQTRSVVEQLQPVLQTARILGRKPPVPEQSLSMSWLKTIGPRLRETETSIVQTAPDKLQVHRKSTLGLAAAELHLIADWLESPQFPQGLHTFPVSAESNR